jgi:ABC-type transport system involved in multi-copper enzyme maturation permease subunit
LDNEIKKRFWKKSWLQAVIGIILITLLIIVYVHFPNPESKTLSQEQIQDSLTNAAQPASKNILQIGQAATVDKFAYMVDDVKYVPELTGFMAPNSNGGEWLVVTISIKNNDTKARTVDPFLFELLLGDSKYEVASGADGSVNDDRFLGTSFNPGFIKTGSVAFNVPNENKYDLKVSSGPFEMSSQLFNLTK